MMDRNQVEDFICFACKKQLENVSALHYHHICDHTLEELSLIIIALKGYEIIIQNSEYEISDQLEILSEQNINEKLGGDAIHMNSRDMDVIENCKYSQGRNTVKIRCNTSKKKRFLEEISPLKTYRSDSQKVYSETESELNNSDLELDLNCTTEIDIQSPNSFLVDGLELDCTNDNTISKFTTDISVQNCSGSPSDADSFQLPRNTPRPDKNIVAVITRLPHILCSNSKSETDFSKTQNAGDCEEQKQFLLPSPVRSEHYAKIDYNYINYTCKNDHIIRENERFCDYFEPEIKIGKNPENADISCNTNCQTFAEKGVQVLSEYLVVLVDKEIQTSLIDTEVNNNLKTVSCKNVHKLINFRPQKAKVGIAKQTPPFTVAVSSYKPTEDSHETKPINSVTNLNTGKSKENNIPVDMDINNRRFYCENCGKGYKKKSHLERHLRSHTGERPFNCPHCSKTFAVRSILNQHVRIHTGEKPYCCQICFQRFPQKSGLMTHTMLHTGKPFKCYQCSKSFVSNHKLIQHQRNHEETQVLVCDICKLEFLTDGAYMEHKKFHILPNKVNCNASDVSFPDEAAVKCNSIFNIDNSI